MEAQSCAILQRRDSFSFVIVLVIDLSPVNDHEHEGTACLIAFFAETSEYPRDA
jgi:hypothetical protein